jgi:hypothetical protein
MSSYEISGGFDIEAHAYTHGLDFFIEYVIAPTTRYRDYVGILLTDITAIVFALGIDYDILSSTGLANVLGVSV